MAQLKNLIVNGASRFIGDIFLNQGLTSDGDLMPNADNTLSVGSASLRWKFYGTLTGSLSKTWKVKLNHDSTQKTYNGSADTDLGTIYAPTSSGTAGYILKSGGVNTAPSWIQIVPTANGGTGNSSFTKDKLIYAETATKLSSYSSTKGGVKKLWYLNAGVPTDSSETVGSSSQPVYMNAGTITQISSIAMPQSAYWSEGITTAGVGWYIVATYNSASSTTRGNLEFYIDSTGGSMSPSMCKVLLELTWSVAAINRALFVGSNYLVGGVRLTKDSSKTYVEIYFNRTAASGARLMVPYNSPYYNVNQSYSWGSGALTASVSGSTVGTTYWHSQGGISTDNISPIADLSYNIGTNTKRFNNVFTNCLELSGPASNPSATAGGRIKFSYDASTNIGGSQPVYLAYTPNDSYRAPAGLKIMGDGTSGSSSPAWLEVEGNIYAAAFKGKADTASAISPAGTTEQFWRGDNTWSNILVGPLQIGKKSAGIEFTDSANAVYGGIWDNGNNLWIGTKSSSDTIHTGGLYLHAGKTTDGKINQAAYLYAGASSTATSATNYVITHGSAGGGSQPVYVDAQGRVTNTSYALKATVNAGTSTAIAYYSGANAISSYARMRIAASNRYPIDLVLKNDAGNSVGEVWYDVGNTTNITSGRWYLREYSPNSTASTATTGYHETYSLPTVTTGRTANAEYNILTTKNTVTVAQGGTGNTSYTANRMLYTNTATKLASSSIITDGSHLTIEHASGGGREYAVTFGSTIDMWMGVGSGNENHGLYDAKASKWMICADQNGNVTVNGNATTATKLATARKLKVALGSTTDITFDGSADQLSIPISGTLGVAHGGTGNTSYTANRLIYSESATKLSSSGHYTSSSKVAINSTSEPSYNLYVNGTSYFNGNTGINREEHPSGAFSTSVGITPLNIFGLKNGYPVYTDPDFSTGANSVGVYNNTTGGNVVHTRQLYSAANVPHPGTSSGYVITIQTKGAASPGVGGFVQSISSRANAVFVQIFRALIPEGRKVITASNSMGASYTDKWLTSQEGTGKWEWYARIVHCGATGTFSSGGHIYLNGEAGTASAPVTWHLAFCNLYDITKGQYDGLRVREADVATTLQTARTINGTSFNGSANITTTNWGTARNIYIADSDGTNTGAAVSVNGSANATLKLPATIKASLSGNATTATRANTTTTTNALAYYTNTTGTFGDSAITITKASKHIAGFINGGQKSGTTLGTGATAEGSETTASGHYSHAEGGSTTASGNASHAEGAYAAASGDYSHAEGADTIASGDSSHAEGLNTTASGNASHAEGVNTTASGDYSHAESYYTTASGNYSHAEGQFTVANARSQHVFGEYNISDSSYSSSDNRGAYIEIVGNGANNSNRSNARTLDWSGNERLAGNLVPMSTNTQNIGTSAVKWATIYATTFDGTATKANKLKTTQATNATKMFILGQSAAGAGQDTYIATAYSSGSANTTGIYFQGSTGVLMGAAWNDYAEFRQLKENKMYATTVEPGRVVYENGDDTLSISSERLMRGCSIVSDTYGFGIGESEKAQLPIAVSGRVLAYPYENREEFKNHIGWPVCSGRNGTVSIMTEEEEMKYPSRIIGTISAVPDYEVWHGGADVIVDGRVWIKVK